MFELDFITFCCLQYVPRIEIVHGEMPLGVALAMTQEEKRCLALLVVFMPPLSGDVLSAYRSCGCWPHLSAHQSYKTYVKPV